MISIIQNLTQANSCIDATETSFGTDKPSIGISKCGGMLNFANHICSNTQLYDKMPKRGIVSYLKFHLINTSYT